MDNLSPGRGKPRIGVDKTVVMNPVGYPPHVTQLGMAPRLDRLEDKTVYLVDLHFYDSGSLLEQVEAWLVEHVPQIKTVLAKKAGQYMEDDPKLFQQIREKGDAMIVGVGH